MKTEVLKTIQERTMWSTVAVAKLSRVPLKHAVIICLDTFKLHVLKSYITNCISEVITEAVQCVHQTTSHFLRTGGGRLACETAVRPSHE